MLEGVFLGMVWFGRDTGAAAVDGIEFLQNGLRSGNDFLADAISGDHANGDDGWSSGLGCRREGNDGTPDQWRCGGTNRMMRKVRE
jgi:hypothetical protein